MDIGGDNGARDTRQICEGLGQFAAERRIKGTGDTGGEDKGAVGVREQGACGVGGGLQGTRHAIGNGVAGSGLGGGMENSVGRVQGGVCVCCAAFEGEGPGSQAGGLSCWKLSLRTS